MNARGTVLIVDDEDYVRESLASLLQQRGFEVRTATSVDNALRPELLAGLDAIITDLKMPGRDGLSLVRELAGKDAPPILVLTAYGTVSSAVECLRAGASDYLLKPTNADELILTLDRCLDQANRDRERDYLRAGGGRGGADRQPIGNSPEWLRVMELAALAATTSTAVLLIGATGTGKEEVARFIHARSERRARAFVAVNCAAIPTELFESEFFGHRRGAFTGALTDRAGRFKIADRGTLLLDEINSLAPAAQAKVLRVLEDGSFERLGDSQPSRTNVRLISASNSRLDEDTAGGRFRADLFYRINGLTIELPALRSRREDIEPLALRFLARASVELGKTIDTIHPRTLELLRAHEWPGNVRELKNMIERGALLEPSGTLRPESLPPLAPRIAYSSETVEPMDGDLRLASVKAHAERRALMEALRRSGGVRKKAASSLGVDERNLAYYLRKHDLMDSDDG